MTDASDAVDLPQGELPDIPFNDASLEGRELEYIQESVEAATSPPAARSRSGRRPCSPRRRAPKRCC